MCKRKKCLKKTRRCDGHALHRDDQLRPGADRQRVRQEVAGPRAAEVVPAQEAIQHQVMTPEARSRCYKRYASVFTHMDAAAYRPVDAQQRYQLSPVR